MPAVEDSYPLGGGGVGVGTRWWGGPEDLDAQSAGSCLVGCRLGRGVVGVARHPPGLGGDAWLVTPPVGGDVVLRLQVQTELVEVGALGPQVAGGALLHAALGAVRHIGGQALGSGEDRGVAW